LTDIALSGKKPLFITAHSNIWAASMSFCADETP